MHVAVVVISNNTLLAHVTGPAPGLNTVRFRAGGRGVMREVLGATEVRNLGGR